MIRPGANDFATATCEPDEVLTGGGYIASPVLRVVSNVRDGDSNSWLAGASNEGSTNQIIVAVAQCAKIV
jgi:hypothetical protein